MAVRVHRDPWRGNGGIRRPKSPDQIAHWPSCVDFDWDCPLLLLHCSLSFVRVHPWDVLDRVSGLATIPAVTKSRRSEFPDASSN
jgi:hypothetical protein